MSGSNSQIAIKVTANSAAAQKEIDALNKRIAGLTKSNEVMSASVLRMSKNAVGLETLGKGMRGFAQQSEAAFASVGRLVPQLGLITGAASLAGIAALESRWANLGTEMLNLSNRTGVGVQALGTLQNSARLAGVSSAAMSDGVKSLADNLTNLAIGRAAPETVAAFSMLHIAAHNADGSIRSAADAMPDIADKIAGMKNPTIQAQYATLLLGSAGEALLPWLRLGKAGIEAYNQKARQYGLMNKAGALAADDLRRRQTELTLSVEGLGYAIAEQLAPVLGPMITQLTNWIAQNRTLIGQDIAKWVGDVSVWVKKAVPEIEAFATKADAVAQALGGWKTVVEGVIRLKLAGWAATQVTALIPLIRLLALIPGSGVAAALVGVGGLAALGYEGAKETGTKVATAGGVGLTPAMIDDFGNPIGYKDPAGNYYTNDEADALGRKNGPDVDISTNRAGRKNPADPKTIHDFFKEKGWSEPQIAGIIANFKAESDFDLGAVGDNGKAAGLGQWRDARRAMFKKRFGHDVSEGTLQEQLQFTQDELTGSEKAAGDALKLAKTPRQAGVIVSSLFERPADGGHQADVRGSYAVKYDQVFNPPADANINDGTGASTPAVSPPVVNGSVTVDINHKNAPEGSTVTAHTKGPIFGGAPRVQQSMPNDGLGGLY